MKEVATAVQDTGSVVEDRSNNDGPTDPSEYCTFGSYNEEPTSTARPVSVERFSVDRVFQKGESIHGL